jgi:hypothetical protein
LTSCGRGVEYTTRRKGTLINKKRRQTVRALKERRNLRVNEVKK